MEKVKNLKEEKLRTRAGQDGSVGRYALFPSTIKRATTNSKTKNKNCQNNELYRSPTTMELKKKHSSRLVGGAEMGSQGREHTWQGDRRGRRSGHWRTGQSHICLWINWEEQLGIETDPTT